MVQRIASVLAAGVLTVAASACGATGSEDADRGRLIDAAQRTAHLPRVEASTLYQLDADGSGDVQDSGCVEATVDLGRPGAEDDRVDVVGFDLNCSGGTHGYELTAIGREVWASADNAPWHAAVVEPGAATAMATADRTRLRDVLARATDVHALSEPGTYAFTVPASALRRGADDGDTDVHVLATVDDQGRLTELSWTLASGEAEAEATVTQTYDPDPTGAIEPPPAKDVAKGVAHLRSADGLRDFLQSAWGCAPSTSLGAISNGCP